MLAVKAGIHKMLVRIANMEEPDKQSELGLLCLGLFSRQQVFKIIEDLP